jgi:hypothetical protein
LTGTGNVEETAAFDEKQQFVISPKLTCRMVELTVFANNGRWLPLGQGCQYLKIQAVSTLRIFSCP